MQLNLNHKRLDVWKLSIKFVSDIYQIVCSFPKEEFYGLITQLRRAALSVPSNIAEGSSRVSPAERKRFYEISRSSLVEIDTQLAIAVELKYCTESQLVELDKKLNHIFAMLSNLIKNTK